ncbi:MAG: fructose 1,6-bisphosphatase [Thaumarchaeota archaeon]|nr:fructose 1,6-bisphosphatase [Nitrososphaerota archaeon]
MKITLSAIKADIGGIGGHTRPSDEVINAVKDVVNNTEYDLLLDYYIGYAGDDIHIIMCHQHGLENNKIHRLAWDAFKEGTEVAKEQGLYGAGQDLLKNSFSGNVKGMGPGVAELEFEERDNEAFVVLAADKTEPGAFNFPFYRTFIDSRSNTGLIINPDLAEGVVINIMDVKTGKIAELHLWGDKPEVEAALMYPGRYVVESVMSKKGEPILSASTDRLHNIAGTYVGKDDPIAIVRCQKSFPATEEMCSAFNSPHFVAGDTRGSHHLPLMPVKINTPASVNYSLPMVIALVFSVHNGKFTGPHDGFATPDWNHIRNIASQRALDMRSQGFIHPATLVPEELEYNKGYEVRMKKLEGLFSHKNKKRSIIQKQSSRINTGNFKNKKNKHVKSKR